MHRFDAGCYCDRVILTSPRETSKIRAINKLKIRWCIITFTNRDIAAAESNNEGDIGAGLNGIWGASLSATSGD
ncbi:hypothetical protein TY91_05750 [Secundilactobacillus collinoides]|uniref:Uncharacterized protein n=2 Tax=Secundilactobacillus collinoides TaxID=33960 RepID=A0A0R2B4G5_SECCO|nr:hypothetical protein FC82_GL000927 [Secundilactobacillus collinoides DSM 20515 = JCM 1123]KZL41721.1 hypothetical protein TY91_05750 [Secundilactobacillus collinoides]